MKGKFCLDWFFELKDLGIILIKTLPQHPKNILKFVHRLPETFDKKSRKEGEGRRNQSVCLLEERLRPTRFETGWKSTLNGLIPFTFES
jgi:hypothetical protein